MPFCDKTRFVGEGGHYDSAASNYRDFLVRNPNAIEPAKRWRCMSPAYPRRTGNEIFVSRLALGSHVWRMSAGSLELVSPHIPLPSVFRVTTPVRITSGG